MPDQLLAATAPSDIAAMAAEQLAKNLVRLPEWSPCTATQQCIGGVLVDSSNEGRSVRCLACDKSIKARRRKEEQVGGVEISQLHSASNLQPVSLLSQDPELRQMIEEKKIRPCPKCNMMTMKEYGICNVINCDQCGIWW